MAGQSGKAAYAFRKAFWAIGAGGILLITLETSFRVYWPTLLYATAGDLPAESWMPALHQASAIPGLDYEMAPDRSVRIATDGLDFTIETNDRGMRDAPVALASGPMSFRIAALGDSWALGWG